MHLMPPGQIVMAKIQKHEGKATCQSTRSTARSRRLPDVFVAYILIAIDYIGWILGAG